MKSSLSVAQGVERSSSSWDALGDSIAVDYETRVEPFTASFIEEMLQPFMGNNNAEKGHNPPHLLDLGSGTGAVSLYATEHGFQVTTTDVAPAMVQRVRQRLSEAYRQDQLVETLATDGQDLPVRWTNRFDFAVVRAICDIMRSK